MRFHQFCADENLVPLHSDYDRLDLVKVAPAVVVDQRVPDAAGGPWLPSDEACPFERHHHLVDGRRADAEILLHVGFGWRPAMQARVEVG